VPTRWMRWNETTHIFEYSTDGVAFGQLPLDASILTQGIIDPARLPDVGGGVDPTVPIDWTGQQTYSGVAPSLRFQETDQAANLKLWDMQVDAQILRFRSLNDAFVATELMTLTRGGILTVKATGIGSHDFQANYAGGNTLSMSNTSAAASAYAGIIFANNLGANRSQVLHMSSTYGAVAGYYPDMLNMVSLAAAAGININAKGGTLTIRTNDIARIGITNAGAISIVGDISLTGVLVATGYVNAATGYYEFGRTVPQGVWINVPYSAGLFTASTGTWTVEAGDFGYLRYMIVGKTCTVSFNIATSTNSASTTYLYIALPAACTCGAYTAQASGRGVLSNAWQGVSISIAAGAATLVLGTLNATNIGSFANSTYAAGTITYEIP